MTIFENSSIITAHNVWENQTTRLKLLTMYQNVWL